MTISAVEIPVIVKQNNAPRTKLKLVIDVDKFLCVSSNHTLAIILGAPKNIAHALWLIKVPKTTGQNASNDFDNKRNQPPETWIKAAIRRT